MSNFSFPFFGPAQPSDTAPTSPGSAPTSSASRPAQTPIPAPSSSLTTTQSASPPPPTSTTPSPTSTSASPPPTSTATTTTTNPLESSSLAPLPSPTAVPVPNSNNTTPNQTTVLRTVTRDGQASVVVITQTLPPNPTTTGAPSPNNRKNEDSGSVLPIAIPCAIAGLIALVGLGLLIRWLKNRSAAARAAEDIKWPEVINSDGDRAALYPEPTRPGMGHGLGDEDEDGGMAGAQMGEATNFAGAGAGNRATLSPNNTGSATTYLNSSSMQDHNSSLQHFYSTNGFPGPPAPQQVSAPQAAYGYYTSTSPPQAYPGHPNALVPGGALNGPREMQQSYGTTDYYNSANHHHQQQQQHHHHQEKYYSKSQDHDQDYELDDYAPHQDKEYEDPLGGKEGAGGYTSGHPIHDQYQSQHYPSYPDQHPSGSPPQHSSSAHHSPPQHPAPSAENPGSPISLSEENFYRDPAARLSDHHLDLHSSDPNAGGGGRRLVALNPDEDT
ncbi:hypothetical protein PGT21_025946 [Puccinia graminis f. sp. tritici]|uniref:Uncharacterized protein n=1 Tax=Puccinia graminis f. sp. tritici TaxID=56615 RepID=A0A5B0Q6H4_PUCGR|nr:hypothetical protein PGT21_025946 [Puccinia graminis f. sp. tritici]